MDIYPAQIRIDSPATSSRGWAILTIIWVKFLTLIPHAIILWALGVAQLVAFFIAQVAVLFTGKYPRGLHEFVTGVLRWQTRVFAFALSLTDEYPPFSLQRARSYPVDIEVDYPQNSSRRWAGLTLGLTVILLITLAARGLPRSVATRLWASPGTFGNWIVNGRDLILLPHLAVLFFLGIAATAVFLIVQ